jgi:membrane-bound lytic murein transglycosylase D
MKILRTTTLLCSLLGFLIGCSNISKTHSVSSARQPASEETAAAAAAEVRRPHPNDLLFSSSPSAPLDRQSQGIVNRALSYCKKSQSCWQKKELEEALSALDSAYSLILELDDQDNPALAKRKEDLRYLISKRILEIYASRNTVAKGQHRAIPIEINRHVQAEIDYLTRGDFFKKAYKRSGRYRAYIVRELRKAGLPVELSWLPLIESGYNVRALSSARALGLWQFIPSTGYRFGLNRDRYIDERMDPYKSTQAAIGYLKALHDMFGDWATVLAAYNCGEGRVLNVIRSQQINYLDHFWDLYERLPNETARYVPRFLATLHIVNNPKKYGIHNIQPYAPIDFDTVTVSKRVTLKDISKHIGVSGDVMKELNPELRRGMLPGTAYALRVPAGKERVLLSKLDNIPVARTPRSVKPVRKQRRSRPAVVHHRVKRGETLTGIARAYRVSVKTIKRANKIRRSNTIVVGRVLKIPGGKAPVVVSKKAAKRPPKVIIYTVRKGDTLWSIARRHGTSPRRIMKANRMKTQNVMAGQKIKIPSRGGTKIASNDALKTYRVKRGDAPLDIAKRHKMTLKRFLHVNNLSYDSKIYPGQKLSVE